MRAQGRLARAWLALRRSLTTSGRGHRLDRETARELQAHLDEQTEFYVARGVPPDEARRRARLEFGSVDAATEGCRDARGYHPVEAVVRDVRHGWRALLAQPVVLVVAVASLACGVGANLTLFSIANAVLFAQPSAAEPGRLVHVRAGTGSHVPYAAWQALDASGAVEGVAGYRLEFAVNLRLADETVPVVPMLVTPNYFDLVRPPVGEGRGISASDAGTGGRVTVITERFGRQYLAGAPPVGARVVVNDQTYTVVGVLPDGSRSLAPFGVEPELYLPVSADLLPAIASPGAPAVQLVARLQPGQSFEAGRAAVAAALEGIGADAGSDELSRLAGFDPVGGLGGAGEFEVVVLFGAVLAAVSGLVLLIACANVAGLLVARAAARRREVAMRLALGATRRRLLQQFLTEGFLLAVVGTVVGLGLAWLAGLVISRLPLPLPVPIALVAAPDARLVSVALVLVLVTTLLCGLLPAMRASRAALLPALHREAARGGAGRLRLRRVLVASQVAVSALLVVIALVFARNLQLTAAVDPGFDVAHTVVAQVQFVEGRQGDGGAPALERAAEAVGQVPGVSAAAASHHVPLTLLFGATVGTELQLSGHEGPSRADFARLEVGRGYFDTMGIGVRGRACSDADRLGTLPVVIVNQAFADRYFPGVDPIGRTVADPREDGPPWQVVGVAADSHTRSLGADREPALFFCVLQADRPERIGHVIARTNLAAADVASAIRQAVLVEDPSAVVTVEPMSEAIGFSFLPSRIGAWVLGALGTLGTALAMVGLFAVVSFAAARRTREFGIRMALGASRSAVVRLVLRDTGAVVAFGIAAGLGLALLVTRPLAAFLVAGLSPSDPVSFLATGALLVAVSGVAAWVPVARATRVDPATTLRHE